MGDWLGWGGTTSSLVLDYEGFAGFAGFFDLITVACLASSVTLGAGFAVLHFLLVFVSALRTGVSVNGPGVGWGIG